VKFTPRGGRVDVRLDTADGMARICIADTGQGIDLASTRLSAMESSRIARASIRVDL